MKTRITALILASLMLLCACEKKAKNVNNDSTAPLNTAETKDTENKSGTTEEQTEPELPPTVGLFSLPVDNTVPDSDLALVLLGLCTGHSEDNSKALLEKAGFAVSLQNNFGKATDDASHTCAYTVGTGTVSRNGKTVDAVIITIRGTDGGEWYSNFDIVPSRNENPEYAENFLLAAQNVLEGAAPYIGERENPVVIVCGHSRGAAAANLLGVLLKDKVGNANLFVYTFATPNTIFDRGDYPYIFNYINPADIVTTLPPSYMGFERAGTDIILDADETAVKAIDFLQETFKKLAADIVSYYSVKHSLFGSGTDVDNGISTFDLMNLVCKALVLGEKTVASALSLISEESDFAAIAALLFTSGSSLFDGDSIGVQHMPQRYAELIAKK